MNWLKSAFHNSGLIIVTVIICGYAVSFNNATGWAIAWMVLGLDLLSMLSLLPRLSRVTVYAKLIPTTTGQLLACTLPKSWRTANVTLTLTDPAIPVTFNPATDRFEATAPLSRGIYTDLIVTLTKTDPLHLLMKKRRQSLKTMLIVPPRPQPASAQALFNQLQPILRTTQAGTNDQPGFETQDFRAYQPGDPSNQIDWKLSARQQQPMLRVLNSDEPQTWCWVFLATTDDQLEDRLAAFYSFVQLVSALPAQVLLIGQTQQLIAPTATEAFASYQPYRETDVPTTTIRQHRVVVFGDDSPLTTALVTTLQPHNALVTTVQWPKGGVTDA